MIRQDVITEKAALSRQSLTDEGDGLIKDGKVPSRSLKPSVTQREGSSVQTESHHEE
jgi:hypothetical protein